VVLVLVVVVVVVVFVVIAVIAIPKVFTNVSSLNVTNLSFLHMTTHAS
jgi:hypothetical protein